MRLIKYFLIVFGVLIGLVFIYSGYYFTRMKWEISKFSPLDTGKMHGVYVIRDDYANMYLLQNNDNFIAVDAGINPKAVKRALDKLAIDPNKIKVVLLTHTDFDHAGAVKLFNQAKIYLSKVEEGMINGKIVRSSLFMKNKLDIPHQLIADNQTIQLLGLKVRGILTPGHTPGSMSFLINDCYLFTGDTLSLKNNKAFLFNVFFSMNSDEQARSIKKLSNLSGVKYLFTAHYGISTK